MYVYDLVGDFLLGYSLWRDSTSSDISRRLAMLAILAWSALRSAIEMEGDGSSGLLSQDGVHDFSVRTMDLSPAIEGLAFEPFLTVQRLSHTQSKIGYEAFSTGI